LNTPSDLSLKVYLAGPLFTQAERRWNRELARGLAQTLGCEVVLPQDFRVGNRKNDPRHFAQLFRLCLDGAKDCDALVAIVDGADADSGTAFEMGYAHALGKPIVAVRTDYRPQQQRGTNLMLARGCDAFVHFLAFNEDMAAVVAEIARKLKAIMRKRSTLK